MTDQSKGHILIVESDSDFASLQKRSVEAAGYSAETAASGREAKAAVAERRPSAVILGLKLPDVDGLTLLRDWRSAGFQAPVLFMTAHGDEKMAAQSLLDGAQDYLPRTEENLGQLAERLGSILQAAFTDREISMDLAAQRLALRAFRHVNDHLTPILGMAELVLRSDVPLAARRADWKTVEGEAARCRALIEGFCPSTMDPPRSEKARRILVIDDELGMRDLMRLVLTKQGFIVDVATDGAEGVAKYKPGTYDLVITDLTLPDKSGKEVVREICGADPKARVMIMTGNVTHADVQGARDMGALYVLVKPFEISVLLAVVKMYARKPEALA